MIPEPSVIRFGNKIENHLCESWYLGDREGEFLVKIYLVTDVDDS